MAIENLKDRAFLNNAHEQRFTIAGIDTTGRVLKWSISLIDSQTGTWDPNTLALEKSSAVTPAAFVRISEGPTDSVVDVVIADGDTATLDAGDYHFELEVFDGAGDNGVVVSAGTLTLAPNNAETI